MKNFYKVLEIKENASSEQIREAFRKLAKKTHPDYYDANEDLYQKFQDINEANRVLSDLHRRTEYDKERKQLKIKKWRYILKGGLVGVLLIIGAYLLNENITTAPVYIGNQLKETTKSGISEGLLGAEIGNVHGTEVLPANKEYSLVRAKTAEQKTKVVNNERFTGTRFIRKNKLPTTARRISVKELSENEMKEISKALNTEKVKSKTLLNCVKIQKTNSSNVSNWETVSVFLQKKGFIISGRETVNTVVEGVQIENSGQCLTLTIGFFPQ